ncbi:MAG TPA: DUF481 domain-containing protein [Gemmatimonadales bacterium]
MGRLLVVVALLACGARAAGAQEPGDSIRSDSTLRVFFDCPGFATGCDFDFLRTEITWVDWVRNREDADVHALVTTEPTGGGGDAYTLTLIGLRGFTGKADTLHYYGAATMTPAEARGGFAHILELGLARYAAARPQAGRLSVVYASPAESHTPATRDRWNYWVFTVSAGTDINGQSQTRSTSYNGSLEANRTTASWKLNFSLNEYYNEDVFKDVPVYDTLGNQIGAQDIKSISRQYGGDALAVRSLGPHWSMGLQGSISRSTFSNLDLSLSIGPAIEYDVFPYAQSTRRQLTLQYGLTSRYFNYADTTIFERTTETLGQQSLTMSLGVTQLWGSAHVSLTGSHYLQDLHKNRLTLIGSVNLRLVKGLSLNVFGNVARIHDQLSLAKAGASDAEILLQRRELLTSYRYFTFVSLRYHFGSTLNNVVNPRFGGAGTFFCC